MNLPSGKKIYFASDFHLGVPDQAGSIVRERIICKWLDEIKQDAAILYLVGDIFDVWFEYKTVVPKGFVRFLGKIAELKDMGIQIEIFTGNHDMWMRDYFEKEFDIPVHFEPIQRTFNGVKMYIAHGDGLGPGDYGYKHMKKVMRNPIAQWLYRNLHPDIGLPLATYFSRRGPNHKRVDEAVFLGEDKEWLLLYCKELLAQEHFDYLIFGHRHFALTYPFPQVNATYINLGDWLTYYSYAEFDGKHLELKYYLNK